MKLAPLAPPPRPNPPGPFTHYGECGVVDDLLVWEPVDVEPWMDVGLPFTGVVAMPATNSTRDWRNFVPSPGPRMRTFEPHERVRLICFVDGVATGDYRDELADIDLTNVVVYDEDHRYPIPDHATATIEPYGGSVLASVNSGVVRRVAFETNGAVKQLQMPVPSDHGVTASGMWTWLKPPPQGSGWGQASGYAGFSWSREGTDGAGAVSVMTDDDGRMTSFSIRGDQEVPSSSPPHDLWLPSSAEEIFDFELASTIFLPNAADFEQRMIDMAPTWMADVDRLEEVGRWDYNDRFEGERRCAFVEQLAPVASFSTLVLGGFHGGENPTELVIHRRMFQIGLDFLASGIDHRVRVDDCMLISTEHDPKPLSVEGGGHIVVDAQTNQLVAVNAPFLRPLHLELMMESEMFEYVRIWAGVPEKKEAQMAPVIARHPSATFRHMDAGRGPEDELFTEWLQNRTGS